MPVSRETLAKVMMMTTSENDHEALAALRRANAMLASSRVNWTDLLVGRSEPRSHYTPPQSTTKGNTRSPPKSASRWKSSSGVWNDEDEINRMFELLFRKFGPRTMFHSFIQDVHQFWERYGYLNDDQYSSIRTSYEKHK